METEIKNEMKEILMRIAKIQSDIKHIKEIEDNTDNDSKLSPIEESLAEIWDNEEDERWNDC